MNDPKIQIGFNPNADIIEIGFVYPKSLFFSSVYLRVGLGEHYFQHKMTLDEAKKLQRGLTEIIQSLSSA